MTTDAANCQDCNRPYGHEHGFPDLVIPFSAWVQISPSGDDGGLLCPSCICKRLHDKGIRCTGAFMSGPIESVSAPLMNALRRVENIELAIAGRDNSWSGVRELFELPLVALLPAEPTIATRKIGDLEWIDHPRLNALLDPRGVSVGRVSAARRFGPHAAALRSASASDPRPGLAITRRYGPDQLLRVFALSAPETAGATPSRRARPSTQGKSL